MKNTLIQVGSYGMGGKESKLGLNLIEKYFTLLNEQQEPPQFMTFYNEGVKLLCVDSPTLSAMENLEKRGTKLLACSTCLNYFNLSEKQVVGISGSMADIIDLQAKAEKIITL